MWAEARSNGTPVRWRPTEQAAASAFPDRPSRQTNPPPPPQTEAAGSDLRGRALAATVGHGFVAGGFLLFNHPGGAAVGIFFYGIGPLFQVVGFSFGVGAHLLGVGAGALSVGFGLGFLSILTGVVGFALFFLFLAAAAQEQADSEEVGKSIRHGGRGVLGSVKGRIAAPIRAKTAEC